MLGVGFRFGFEEGGYERRATGNVLFAISNLIEVY
jgi:hypothetical protein